MRYMGGKFRHAGPIAAIITKHLKPGMVYVEPFCGACNVTAKINWPVRMVSDSNAALITMYKALQDGWIPPMSATKAEHDRLKDAMDVNDPLTAFYGFGCSFRGKWFGGFGGDVMHGRQTYCVDSSKSIEVIRPWIQSAIFSATDYQTLNPVNAVIYCDPPYTNTTSYKGGGSFNTDEFWQTVDRWRLAGNVVLVSEYVAPAEWVAVWTAKTKVTINGSYNGLPRVERLFMHESQAVDVVSFTPSEQCDLL